MLLDFIKFKISSKTSQDESPPVDSKLQEFLWYGTHLYLEGSEGKRMYKGKFKQFIKKLFKSHKFTPDILYDTFQGYIEYKTLHCWYYDARPGRVSDSFHHYPDSLRKQAFKLLETDDIESVYFKMGRKISYTSLGYYKSIIRKKLKMPNLCKAECNKDFKRKIAENLKKYSYNEMVNLYPDINPVTLKKWYIKGEFFETFNEKMRQKKLNDFELKKEIFEKLKTKDPQKLFKEYNGEIPIQTLLGWQKQVRKGIEPTVRSHFSREKKEEVSF